MTAASELRELLTSAKLAVTEVCALVRQGDVSLAIDRAGRAKSLGAALRYPVDREDSG